MTDPTDSGWTLRLPCTRAEAERLDAQAETLFAAMEPPPVLAFAEGASEQADDWRLEAYFADQPTADTVEAIHALLPSAAGATPIVEPVANHDWVALSQAGMPPIDAGRFHIRNSADDPARGDPGDFLIPASRAFGTGQHNTTRGCLLALDALRARGQRFGNIADIGTGTGILAFAARTLWPRAHIIASDIDPAAVEVTAANMVLNAVPGGGGPGRISLAVAPGTDHPEIAARAPYDLIIANILAGPLIALAPALAAQLEEGGSLLLAGLLDSQAPAVLAACRRSGLRLAHRHDEGNWPVLHLRKRRRFGTRRAQRWANDGTGVAPGFGSW